MRTTIVNLILWFCLLAGQAATAEQRLELESTEIVGVQEMPRIVTVLSWQRTTPLDLPIIESRLQAELPPLDRAEFERALRYRELQRAQGRDASP